MRPGAASEADGSEAHWAHDPAYAVEPKGLPADLALGMYEGQ
jgi:hypothetical protein